MKIEQVDREAAASAYYAWISGNPVIPKKMRSGEADDHSMVQAFARHRIQALEEAAKVARGAGSHSVGGGDGGTYVIGTALDAYHAIRALDPTPPVLQPTESHTPAS